MDREEVAARALFATIYDGCLDPDDPAFPERVWAGMSDNARAPWRRKAKAVLAAVDAADPSVL